MSTAAGETVVSRNSRLLLAMAAVAVAFAAADTYVVVLALPDMMTGVGVPIDQLQRAAPIVSGFLLGYVAMLPLIGRIADLRGRTPVLVAALGIFAFGSLVTAAAYDLGSLVTGRFLQGVGGGGLVPVTLALVADLYPVERRGVPLGIVSAVQEIGSVVGPLFGALVLAVADWQAIFLINLAVALVLATAIRRLAGGEAFAHHRTRGRPDYLGMAAAAVTVTRQSRSGLRYLIALPIRFCSSCRSSVGSPPTTGRSPGTSTTAPLSLITGRRSISAWSRMVPSSSDSKRHGPLPAWA